MGRDKAPQFIRRFLTIGGSDRGHKNGDSINNLNVLWPICRREKDGLQGAFRLDFQGKPRPQSLARQSAVCQKSDADNWGEPMRRASGLLAAAVAITCCTAAGASAADLAITPGGKLLAGAQLVLTCDNGRVYPIRARAVSDAGELVTGYIQTAPRKSHHFRLIPMGTGYRYAGLGFWFDGVRNEATLDIGTHQAACTVQLA
jgi:hypothetical protein